MKLLQLRKMKTEAAKRPLEIMKSAGLVFLYTLVVSCPGSIMGALLFSRKHFSFSESLVWALKTSILISLALAMVSAVVGFIRYWPDRD